MPCTHVCTAGDTEETEGDGVAAKEWDRNETERLLGRSELHSSVPRTRLVPKLAMHLPSLGDSYPSCGKNSPVHLHRDASLQVDDADESSLTEIATSRLGRDVSPFNYFEHFAKKCLFAKHLNGFYKYKRIDILKCLIERYN